MKFHRSVTPSQVENEISSLRWDAQKKIKVRNQANQFPHIIQVTNFLFCGSLEAAFNEQLLCRYQIGSLVDVSAQHPNQVARERKSFCPCTCRLPDAHCRAKLIVYIEANDKEDIVPYFKEINTFIHYHRRQCRNVLVYSNAGVNRAPTIIAQYLLQMEHHSLAFTFAHMAALRPQTNISPHFMLLLHKLERRAARKTLSFASIVSGLQNLGIKTPGKEPLIDKFEKLCVFKTQASVLENNTANCYPPTESADSFPPLPGTHSPEHNSIVNAWT